MEKAGRVNTGKGNVMRLKNRQSKPSLLMLSDCFPDQHGDERAVRAWQLLSCAVSTHEVYLAVATDRAVNLVQWRRVGNLTRRVHIESIRPRLFRTSRLRQGWRTWAQRWRFDTLLATSPSVWPKDIPVQSRTRLCDFTVPSDTGNDANQAPVGLLNRLSLPGFRRHTERMDVARVIAECDIALVSPGRIPGVLSGTALPVHAITGPDAVSAWSALFNERQALAERVTPEVTMMPLQPVPSRQAA